MIATFAALDEWSRRLSDGSRAAEMQTKFFPRPLEAHGSPPLPLRAWAPRIGEDPA